MCCKLLRLIHWGFGETKPATEKSPEHYTMGICLAKGLRLCQMPGDTVMSANRLTEESPAGSRVEPSLFAFKYIKVCTACISPLQQSSFATLHEYNSKSVKAVTF